MTNENGADESGDGDGGLDDVEWSVRRTPSR